MGLTAACGLTDQSDVPPLHEDAEDLEYLPRAKVAMTSAKAYLALLAGAAS